MSLNVNIFGYRSVKPVHEVCIRRQLGAPCSRSMSLLCGSSCCTQVRQPPITCLL
jgi:hypothetical protein